jgi:NADH-quinone oxidoreductase subunit E
MTAGIAKQAKDVLKKHPAGEPSALVNVLHDIQGEFRYLPEEALRLAAEHLEISAAQVFGVASFFEGFHLKPRGEHICTVCMGTACHVRGAPRLLEQAERDLKIASGQTTADMQFTLEEVNCVGACALGPLVIIDGEYNGNMTPHRLTKLVDKIKKKGK